MTKTIGADGKEVVDKVEDKAPETGTVVDKVEDKEVKTVSYERFKEVNDLKKAQEEELKTLREFKAQEENKKLLDKGEYEKALQAEKDKYQKETSELSTKVLNYEKEKILNKYGITSDYTQFVTGATLEDIEANAKTLGEKLKIKPVDSKQISVSDKTDEKKTNTLGIKSFLGF